MVPRVPSICLLGPLHISMGHETVYIASEHVPHVCFDPPVLSTVLKHMPFICFRNLELIVSRLVHPSSSQEVPADSSCLCITLAQKEGPPTISPWEYNHM